jgi:hypothetical protein
LLASGLVLLPEATHRTGRKPEAVALLRLAYSEKPASQLGIEFVGNAFIFGSEGGRGNAPKVSIG